MTTSETYAHGTVSGARITKTTGSDGRVTYTTTQAPSFKGVETSSSGRVSRVYYGGSSPGSPERARIDALAASKGGATPTTEKVEGTPAPQATFGSKRTDTLKGRIESGVATEQERRMYESQTAFDREGRASQPYYTDSTGRKWTESQLYFVDPTEAAALRYAAATKSPRPKITTYRPEQKAQAPDPADAILLPSIKTHEPVKSTDELKRIGTAATASGVIAKDKTTKGNALADQINKEYSSFNTKWGGAGTLDASQSYSYVLEKQALEKKTAPLKSERRKLISGANVFTQRSAEYTDRYNKGREEIIPIVAKETARQMEKESIAAARSVGAPSTTGEVFETVGRGAVSGAGFGLVAGGLGLAPWAPATVVGGALSGAVGGAGYEFLGKTVIAGGVSQIKPSSEWERKYLMVKPIPSTKMLNQPGGLVTNIAKWASAAPGSPTLEAYVEAEMRGEDTYKDYELFNPSAAVQGAQIGFGLLGASVAIEGSARAASWGTPRLMALRDNLKGVAKMEGDFTFDKNTKLLTGETQADLKLTTGKGETISSERLSIGRGERVKVYASNDQGGTIASKSDITTYKSGKVPEFGKQYDLTRYKVVGKGGGTTDIYAQGASVGGGKARISEMGLRVYETSPNEFMVKAGGKIIPVNPTSPKIDVIGDFRFHGIEETKVLTGPGPVKMIPPSGGPKTPLSATYGPKLPGLTRGIFKSGGALPTFGASSGSGSSAGASFSGGVKSLSPYMESKIVEEVSLTLLNPPGTSFSNIPPGALVPPGITTIGGTSSLYTISEPVRSSLNPSGGTGPKKIRRPGGKLQRVTRPEYQTITAPLPAVTGIETPSEKALTSRVKFTPAVISGSVKAPGLVQIPGQTQITGPIQIPVQKIKPVTTPITSTKTVPGFDVPTIPIIGFPPGPEIPKIPTPPVTPPVAAPKIPLGVWGKGEKGGARASKRVTPRYKPSVAASIFNIVTPKKQKATGWTGLEIRPLVSPLAKKKTKKKSKKKRKK